MRKFFLVLMAICLLVMPISARAEYGLTRYWFDVVDEFDRNVTSGTTNIDILVYTQGSSTKATIYSDEQGTAKSQTAAWHPTTGGLAEFWSSASSVDVTVEMNGQWVKKTAMTVGDHRIMLRAASPTTIQRSIRFPITSMLINDTAISLPTTSTTPGLETDNLLTSLVWADGETTPAEATFTVPDDYMSGAAFRLTVDESGSTTHCEVDFLVYLNTPSASGGTWDTAATDQTPVACANTAGKAGTITLTPATDLDTLTPGQLITLQIWRDDTATGTNDLEVYLVEFIYKAGD